MKCPECGAGMMGGKCLKCGYKAKGKKAMPMPAKLPKGGKKVMPRKMG